MAVKTKLRFQSMYNILLACLAGTDLLVGTVTQPAFVATEMFAITGDSVATYCSIFKNILRPLVFLSILPSLFHLTLISIERYIAMKYALQYFDIVTKFRLAKAVMFSWFLAVVYTLLRFFLKVNFIVVNTALPVLVIFCLLAITYCHFSVYLTTRRHQRKIRTEQISVEAAAKFLKEKKAWKTTGIIIGFVFLSYLLGLVPNLAVMFGFLTQESRKAYFWRNITYSGLTLNSLCNPIIYCWRSKSIRKEMVAFFRKENQN